MIYLEPKGKNMDRLVFEGTVKTYQNQTFVLDDKDNSIYGWIHKITRDWEGKKIRVTIEKIESQIEKTL